MNNLPDSPSPSNPPQGVASPPDLTKPAVTVEALQGFLLDPCADLFADLTRTGGAEKVLALAEVVAWAMSYQTSYRQHDGLVSRELNDLAPQMIVRSVNILYGTTR